MKKIMYKGKELLSPKNDLVFKAIFGTETDKEVLADFLSAMLELEIEDFELFNSEIPAEYEGGKSCRLDLRVRTTKNEHINVEIQLLNEKNLLERAIVYSSSLVMAQLKSGMDYSQLGKVISLIIVDFNLFNKSKSWYNVYRLKNCKTNEELTDLVQFAFVELPKLANVEQRAKELQRLDSREKWALFLSTDDSQILEFLEKDNAVLERAVKKLVYISEDEKMRFLCEMRFKAELDAYNHELFIKREAAAAAMEDGLQRGIERGIEQGIEQKALEDAQNLKKKGIPDEIIAECVGLSLETVREL